MGNSILSEGLDPLGILAALAHVNIGGVERDLRGNSRIALEWRPTAAGQLTVRGSFSALGILATLAHMNIGGLEKES